ncbi:C25 family cysteine peptidase [Chitinophagaceae bacterium LB-8]|uniref:C25 family cysteine peptidase n=1 Tax=Paraflavisolibacter caeni TaxID=2982496 RepID=A0A9X3BIH0_9BACT|nr:C25 family cysteine peptidase [Paraflavisolibacter caeni]MCU7550028.1 C25 family cysteine peptidase [Paraflavisolibacter caeni]
MNDYYSLISDTAYYFLTVNPSGGNTRLATIVNETAGNTLAPEPYFMYTIGNYTGNKINGGLAYYPGAYLYSSSYDQGEGWTSGDIGGGGNHTTSYNNLFVYPSGPSPKFKISVSGNSIDIRTYSVLINSDTILNKAFNYFEYTTDSVAFPLSKLSSGTATVRVTNSAGNMVIHKYELTYPRLFNFGASKNYEFILPSSSNKRYLEISNFAFGTVAPVLYDLTNGKRYVGDISAKPLVKFVIQPSLEARYVLINEESTNINSVTALQQRNFINYADVANQGDFLLISNPLLFNGTNGSNPVEEYRAYRSSAAGGGYNAKVCLVDELTDQFAFGIKKHPVGLRNFILFARQHFTTAPKHVLLLGKGVDYTAQRYNESNVNINLLNLVPTFGSPASDVLLTADPGSSVGRVSIGRISAINAQEVIDYLDKAKEFDAAQAQALVSPEAKDKLWMKNVLHIIGVSEPVLQATLESSMSSLNSIISDTLYGAKVTTLTKQTGNNVEQINSVVLNNLFTEGMSLITYFGHSGASTLSFNLDNPESYNNKGKYPLFIAMGCNVGNIYDFNTSRYSVKQTLSESYVLTPSKGTIGFIASTHYGVVRILDTWSQNVYNTISRTDYGKSIGDVLNIAADKIHSMAPEDFYFRCNMEQMAYHGDPSIKLNTHPKPDYFVNDQLVTVSPTFVSISEPSFKVKAKFLNIGAAVNRDIAVEIKREYPDQTSQVVYRDTLNGLLLSDSIILNLPIDPQRDKGLNKLTITIDADNAVDELFENNNTTTKEVFIYQDEARPIYPYNYAIVNDPNVKLSASTADPFSLLKNYKVEMDTTELFNSPLKVTKTIESRGGMLEYQPGVTLRNNTVYYWRVAIVPASGEYHWSNASFIYLKDSESGFNQSHYYQHLKSESKKMYLDSASRKWEFGLIPNDLYATNTIFPTGGSTDADFAVNLNTEYAMRSACVGRSLIFNVFDAKTLKPWKNVDDNGANLYLYGSGSANCKPTRNYNFEFSYLTSASRKLIMNFMDTIPNGSYVVVRSIDYNTTASYSSNWRSDTALFGSGNSLYHKLLQAGFANIDSIDRPRAWILIYQKNNNSFKPKYAYTQGIYDNVKITSTVFSRGNNGVVESPVFGPAKSWRTFMWEGAIENQKTITFSKIIGIRTDNSKDTLFNSIEVDNKVTDISSISASKYPYLQLYMTTMDTTDYLPHQLKYWRLTYDPIPEGAIAPNIYFSMKDSLEAGEEINFKVAFKNVSKTSFDSIKLNLVIIDANNVRHVLPVVKQRPLGENDTLHVSSIADSKQFTGRNTLYVEVNPDNDQPEQFHFNNFIYKDFYVNQDLASPILDVTFDNIHILNGDIVASKPNIVIKMKDESSKLLLNDSSLLTVKVRYPDNTIRTFSQDSDTLRFVPAVVGTDNTATIEFNPYFTEDGDYELIVYGEDKSGNKAGNTEYRIAFKVINKPMISNMFNYPNPFTTSTAFVFTLTGSEVPQNMKIQILTITGKVVREITKQELGYLHIGRNITEFKWDGTDQYGQKLANGVYLYRVVTSLNGKSLDKYKAEDDQTDKYFNKGYGKMYLMR